MPLQDLTPPPTPPSRDDTPDVFIERADAFVAWQAQFASEMNTLSAQLEATAALIAVAPAYADAGLLALAGKTPAADRLPYYTGSTTSALATFTALARTLLAGATQSSMQSTLGVYSTTQVDSAIATAVTGLFDYKGGIDCSANPNYPSASAADAYVVSVAGKIGGASGTNVDVGDMIVAKANNAGGTQASVGTSWTIFEHNLVGALLAANNLSDVTNTTTARNNIGATGIGTISFGTNTIYAEIKLPNGDTLLIQGGTGILGSGTTGSITFTASYSVNPVVVVGGARNNTGDNGSVNLHSPATASGVSIVNTAGGSSNYTWLAIGKA